MPCMCGDLLCLSCGFAQGTPACRLCGELYLDEGHGDFCSKKCAKEWDTGTLKCAQCGKKVLIKKAYESCDFGLCSKKCADKFYEEEERMREEEEREAAEYMAWREEHA